MRNTSFGLHHRILNDKGELAAEAHDVLVYFDFNRDEKELLPESYRNAIDKLENRAQ
jgi:acyl-CoA thioester hydrolase